jgi:hypothetical protein
MTRSINFDQFISISCRYDNTIHSALRKQGMRLEIDPKRKEYQNNDAPLALPEQYFHPTRRLLSSHTPFSKNTLNLTIPGAVHSVFPLQQYERNGPANNPRNGRIHISQQAKRRPWGGA